MACCNPLSVEVNGRYFNVPCGYCLNCRVDKRNWLEDCCRAAEAKYKSSCFAVLTYDDNHLADRYKVQKDGSLCASLSKSDAVNFLKRFRSHLEYYSNLYSMSKYVDTVDGKIDFKYVLVGEYGEHHRSGLVNRPHFHILMFGIDPMIFRSAFESCWENGDVFLGDVQPGGIRYVLKYLDKQIKGLDAVSKYDENGLERPFQTHSQMLGYEYFYDNIDEIKKNNWTYLTRHNKRRPLNSYLKKKFMAETEEDNSFIISNLNTLRVTPSPCQKGQIYSLMQINAERHREALERNRKLAEMSRRDGFPAFDDSIFKSAIPYRVDKLAQEAFRGDLSYIPF